MGRKKQWALKCGLIKLLYRHENVCCNLVVASYINKTIELGFRPQLEKEEEEEQQQQQPWFSSKSNLSVLS